MGADVGGDRPHHEVRLRHESQRPQSPPHYWAPLALIDGFRPAETRDLHADSSTTTPQRSRGRPRDLRQRVVCRRSAPRTVRLAATGRNETVEGRRPTLARSTRVQWLPFTFRVVDQFGGHPHQNTSGTPTKNHRSPARTSERSAQTSAKRSSCLAALGSRKRATQRNAASVVIGTMLSNSRCVPVPVIRHR